MDSKKSTITSALPIGFFRVFAGTSMVAGCAIGAGMLGIPFITAKNGIFGASLITTLVWVFMLLTGLFFAEVAIKMPKGSNILSITKHYAGKKCALFSGIMFAFLYYCLLTAYIAGSGPLIQELVYTAFHFTISPTLASIIYTLLFSMIIYSGVSAVDKSTRILMIGMVLFYCFFILSSFTSSHFVFRPSIALSEIHLAVPLLFGAFGYHNIIPSLCDYLERDTKSIKLSIVLGTAIALIMYLIWQILILSSIPLDMIHDMLAKGLTPLYALKQITSNNYVIMALTYFSFCALTSSVLGVGLSLVDFLKDGFASIGIKKSTIYPLLITSLPPLGFCLINPHIFYRALSLAGGFGESYLNGILPILLFWSALYIKREKPSFTSFSTPKYLFILLLAIAFSVIGIELIQNLKIVI